MLSQHQRGRVVKIRWLYFRAVYVLGFGVALTLMLWSPSGPQTIEPPVPQPGQSVTLLSDGRWLFIGGESAGGSLGTASIWDPRTGTTTTLAANLQHPRAWHTATVLPDGTVFVFGGVGARGDVLAAPELFDPATQTFESFHSEIANPKSEITFTPRSRHTATLLTDGTLLFAGGLDANDQTLRSAELWDHADGSVSPLPALSTARQSHTATLLDDGKVLLRGGSDNGGNALNTGDLFDPTSEKFAELDAAVLNTITAPPTPYLAGSLPVHNASDVASDTIISLRFSKPLRVETVNSDTVTLSGPKGIERIKVVVAEGGMLAFLTPEAALLPGATYSVTISGSADKDGLLLPASGISFSTKPSALGTQPSAPTTSSSSQPGTRDSKLETASATQDDGFVWTGKLKDGKPHSDWEDLPPLEAPPGVTALSGQVLNLNGLPLANVALDLEDSGRTKKSKKIETDETGRFLLTGIEAGWQELIIDGGEARQRPNPKSSGLGPKEDHGVFEYGVEIKEGKTTVLPFTIWLPKIDIRNAVKLPSPITSEFVVTSPKIPGLELRILPNTVIYDHEGELVKEISLTLIPLDRTPFPLPANVKVPIYFTAQPGGAYLYGSAGARIIYPNVTNEPPNTEWTFWHYSADERWWRDGEKGWYVYGKGKVTADGTQIVPHPGFTIYEFTGAMVAPPALAPDEGPKPCCDEGSDGDPVDLFTGLFLRNDTDFSLQDVIPLSLTQLPHCFDQFGRIVCVSPWFSSKDCSDFENSD